MKTFTEDCAEFYKKSVSVLKKKKFPNPVPLGKTVLPSPHVYKNTLSKQPEEYLMTISDILCLIAAIKIRGRCSIRNLREILA